MPSNTFKPFVVVRTFSAGVFSGYVDSRDGKEIQLSEARRIWRWKGANTISEIVNNGCDMEYTRISEPTCVILTEAIEIHKVEVSSVIKNLTTSRWPA